MKKLNLFVGSALMLSTFVILSGCQQSTAPTTSVSPTNTATQSTTAAPVKNITAETQATSLTITAAQTTTLPPVTKVTSTLTVTPTPAPAPAPSPKPAQVKQASTAAVNIQNMAFNKNSVTVSVGATVTWTNHDAISHTVTSDTGLFSSGSIANGKSFAFTFSKAGTYGYHCSIHPSMTGTVIVK